MRYLFFAINRLVSLRIGLSEHFNPVLAYDFVSAQTHDGGSMTPPHAFLRQTAQVRLPPRISWSMANYEENGCRPSCDA